MGERQERQKGGSLAQGAAPGPAAPAMPEARIAFLDASEARERETDRRMPPHLWAALSRFGDANSPGRPSRKLA